MPLKKKDTTRLFVPKTKRKNDNVEYGKYSTRQFKWVVKYDPDYFKQIKKLYYEKYDYTKRMLYDRMYDKHFKNAELFLDKKQEIVDIFLLNRRQGKNVVRLKESMTHQYKGISLQFLNECADEAKAIIKKEFEIEKDFLVDIHILRYEELFDKAINPDIERIPIQYRNSFLSESYINALDILAQKEKSLGIHSKTFKLQINNYLQQKKFQAKKTINFDILSFKEQVELLNLIEATKVSDLAPQKTIQTSTIVSTKEKLVIETKIEAPIRNIGKTTDIIAEDEEEKIVKKGKTLSEIQNSIHENLRKQVEDALKKKKK